VSDRGELRQRSARGPILSTAGVVAVALLAFASRYGYHRDELYFLACGRRLTWGFVDQPPLTPALARLPDVLFPGSLVGLRLWPALMTGALVVLGALTARELGAGWAGQVAAAICVACTPGFLLAGHLLSTETFDLVAWAATTFLVIRIVGRAEPRLWPVVGVTIGLGLENKWSIVFLVAGLLIGIAITAERRVLWTPWLAAGVAVAFVMWLPNLIWQADHAFRLPARRTADAAASALADSPVNDLNPEMGEQVGWPALVAEVAGVWDRIPAGERSSAIVLTANYGEAGAIERFGPGVGLPHPYSGHNMYWWWGPPPADTRIAVVVGWSRPYAERFFGSVERAGTIRNAFGVDNDEEGAPVWVATEPRRPLPSMWRATRHYD
jgi:dolichyl-phosphate-mannose-protein mannosyltransferase